jgi:pimeloyl-ACP methyl ester carboxylesterase
MLQRAKPSQVLPMLHEQTNDCDGLSLNVAVGPESGPPLVLFHGVLRGWRDFAPLLPSLIVRWQVFAPDQRGHGRSQHAAAKYRVVDYVRDAVALLRDHVPGPAVLYGHSLGAMVALAAACQQPDRVRALVLEDPPFDTMGNRLAGTPLHEYFAAVRDATRKSHESKEGDDGQPDVDALAAVLADIPVAAPSGGTTRLGNLRDAPSLRFSASCLTRLDPDVFEPIVEVRWLDGYDELVPLDRVTCPTLLLQADESAGGMLIDADAERLKSTLPRCLRVKMAGVGHLIHWTKTEDTLRLVVAFLESVDRTP